jgi:hypothetical protein
MGAGCAAAEAASAAATSSDSSRSSSATDSCAVIWCASDAVLGGDAADGQLGLLPEAGLGAAALDEPGGCFSIAAAAVLRLPVLLLLEPWAVSSSTSARRPWADTRLG